MAKKKEPVVATRATPPEAVRAQANLRAGRISKYQATTSELESLPLDRWLKAENITDLEKFRNAMHQYAYRRGMRLTITPDPNQAGVVWLHNVGARPVPPTQALPEAV